MRPTPLVKIKDNEEKRLDDVIVRDVSFIGLRVLPPTKVNEFGRLNLLFTLSTEKGAKKNGTDYYVQKIYTLDSDSEKKFFASSPYNVANFDEEMAETYKSLVEPMDLGTNAFGSFFTFVENDTEKGKFYKIEALASAESSKTDVIIGFNFTKRCWVIINQLMYWVLMGMPINTSIYTDDRYEHIKITHLTGMIYEGSTGMEMEDGSLVELSHFTLYYKDGNIEETYPMNVMSQGYKDRLHSKPLTNAQFQSKWHDTDTLSTLRFFMFTSPEKGFAVLGVCPIIDGFNVMIVPEEVATRIHWLDWNYYVYVQTKEDK